MFRLQPAEDAAVKLPSTLPFITVTASVAPVMSGSATAMAEKGATVALSVTAWLADAPVIAGVSWIAVTTAVAVWFEVALAPPAWLAASVTVTAIVTGAALPGAMPWAFGVNATLRSTVCSWAAVPLAVSVPVEAL